MSDTAIEVHSPGQILAIIEGAKQALALASSVREVKDLRDKAEAIRLYTRQRDSSFEVQNSAAELKVRAERRLGELLREVVPHEGGRPEKRLQAATVSREARLQDMGIEKTQSHRWQQIATVPEARFEQYLEERKTEREEITSADLLRIAATPPSNRPTIQGYGHSDQFQTPADAVTPLLAYLRPCCVVWECAWGKGQLADTLEGAGHAVIRSDVQGGQDFLTWEPAAPWDCIVTNPPYSLKNEFLARAYALGRPFAFLLPLASLEGQTTCERSRSPSSPCGRWTAGACSRVRSTRAAGPCRPRANLPGPRRRVRDWRSR